MALNKNEVGAGWELDNADVKVTGYIWLLLFSHYSLFTVVSNFLMKSYISNRAIHFSSFLKFQLPV